MKLFKYALIASSMAVMPLAQTQAKVTVVGQPGIIQVPSEASLQKLMQVMQVDKTFSEMTQRSDLMVDETLKQAFNSHLQDDSLTASQKSQIQIVIADFTKKMLAEQNTPAMRQKFINAYMQTAQDTYSQQEVNAMIDFYGSALGQSVATKQTEFGTVYMQKIMPIIFENQQKTMQKYLPEMQQKLEKIIDENPNKTKSTTKTTTKKATKKL